MDIYAGSIPFKIKEKQLNELFSQFGEVTSVKIIIDNITRQNKGFAFIVMPNDDEALLAIETLDGTELMGRKITVSISEDKKKPAAKKKNWGKGGTNFKGSFDKSTKEFPGKSGFQRGSSRGAAKGGGRRGR
ncbi:MAG: RNA-binding protein [Chitinophagales bacterium]